MMKLEVLTTSLGCPKCERAMGIIKEVLIEFKGKVKVTETDIVKHPEKLSEFGIMTTPAIIINGKLAFEGTPSKEQLKKKLKEALK